MCGWENQPSNASASAAMALYTQSWVALFATVKLILINGSQAA
jgi:hypothetical protein